MSIKHTNNGGNCLAFMCFTFCQLHLVRAPIWIAEVQHFHKSWWSEIAYIFHIFIFTFPIWNTMQILNKRSAHLLSMIAHIVQYKKSSKWTTHFHHQQFEPFTNSNTHNTKYFNIVVAVSYMFFARLHGTTCVVWLFVPRIWIMGNIVQSHKIKMCL